MFALGHEDLPPKVQVRLDKARDDLLEVGDYIARVAAAPRHWDNLRAGVVRPIRETLRSMCGDAEPCCYCGDSVGVSVDHIRPKALYPEHTFVWANLLLACARCNTTKGDRFAVIIEGELIDVTRPRNAEVIPPLQGAMALIDLREELHLLADHRALLSVARHVAAPPARDTRRGPDSARSRSGLLAPGQDPSQQAR